MKTYRLSARGRQTTILLLIGALAIWGFALWSFRDTLQLSYDPRLFLDSLNTTIQKGLPVSKLIPAFLMLVLIIATPLLIWNLLEEWAARYTPTNEGLHFSSLGISLTYPWDAIQAIRRVDDDADEPIDEILITGQHAHQIPNPFLRFLHQQAYGRNKLPLYPGIESREELLAEIEQRMTPPGQREPERITEFSESTELPESTKSIEPSGIETIS